LVSAAQQPLLPGTPQATGRSVGAGAGPPRGDKSDGQEAPAHRPSEPYPAEKARGGRIILKTRCNGGCSSPASSARSSWCWCSLLSG